MQKRMYAAALADDLMERYPKADMYPYKSWSYPQGFLLWGFIRLYEKTGREEYCRYVMDYCEQHVDFDGNICLFTGVSLDDIMTASVIVWAYHFTGDSRYKRACMQVRETFRDYPRNSDDGFWHGKDRPGEMWVDGVFMGLMFLVRYGNMWMRNPTAIVRRSGSFLLFLTGVKRIRRDCFTMHTVKGKKPHGPIK